jgi:hypothetical protein
MDKTESDYQMAMTILCLIYFSNGWLAYTVLKIMQKFLSNKRSIYFGSHFVSSDLKTGPFNYRTLSP